MNWIAVLVGARSTGGLDAAIVSDARAAVGGGEPVWLADGLAAEFALTAPSWRPVDALIRQTLAGRPIDIAVLPAEGRRKRLFVADMDSTIIGCECIDELANFAGVKVEVSGITERAMRGELDFPSALRHRVELLKGLPLHALQQAYDERVRLNPGARTLVQTMAAASAVTALVSGGFTFFTARVAAAAGFAFNRANVLIDDGAALTGEVGEPILGREAKLAALLELATANNLEPSDCIAVGDGANDLAMIEAAGLGVAYRAKPVVADAARARIDYADLTALLYFQGYRESEFAA
ncbi:MAG: phosphoserine phosphatase SerB [Micropepsaceae bacterium]